MTVDGAGNLLSIPFHHFLPGGKRLARSLQSMTIGKLRGNYGIRSTFFGSEVMKPEQIERIKH